MGVAKVPGGIWDYRFQDFRRRGLGGSKQESAQILICTCPDQSPSPKPPKTWPNILNETTKNKRRRNCSKACTAFGCFSWDWVPNDMLQAMPCYSEFLGRTGGGVELDGSGSHSTRPPELRAPKPDNEQVSNLSVFPARRQARDRHHDDDDDYYYYYDYDYDYDYDDYYYYYYY